MSAKQTSTSEPPLQRKKPPQLPKHNPKNSFLHSVVSFISIISKPPWNTVVGEPFSSDFQTQKEAAITIGKGASVYFFLSGFCIWGYISAIHQFPPTTKQTLPPMPPHGWFLQIFFDELRLILFHVSDFINFICIRFHVMPALSFIQSVTWVSLLGNWYPHSFSYNTSLNIPLFI